MAISELKKKLSEFFEKGYIYFPVDGSDTGAYSTDFHTYLNDEYIIPWDNSTGNFLKPLYYWIEYISQYYDFFKEKEKLVTFVRHNDTVGYIVFGKLDDWAFISVDISKENYDGFDSLELAINEFHDNVTESDKTPKTEKQIATADQLADSATVISGKMVEVEGDGPFWNEQEFTIKRFKDNSIKIFQEDGMPMDGSVKAFLSSIIKQYSLDVEIEKKNTRTIGKKVIEALNSK